MLFQINRVILWGLLFKIHCLNHFPSTSNFTWFYFNLLFGPFFFLLFILPWLECLFRLHNVINKIVKIFFVNLLIPCSLYSSIKSWLRGNIFPRFSLSLFDLTNAVIRGFGLYSGTYNIQLVSYVVHIVDNHYNYHCRQNLVYQLIILVL